MIPDVESSFSKICKLELDGKLLYQKQLQPAETSANTAPVSVYIYVFSQFGFFPSNCLWRYHFANPLVNNIVLLIISVFPLLHSAQPLRCSLSLIFHCSTSCPPISNNWSWMASLISIPHCKTVQGGRSVFALRFCKFQFTYFGCISGPFVIYNFFCSTPPLPDLCWHCMSTSVGHLDFPSRHLSNGLSFVGLSSICCQPVD